MYYIFRLSTGYWLHSCRLHLSQCVIDFGLLGCTFYLTEHPDDIGSEACKNVLGNLLVPRKVDQRPRALTLLCVLSVQLVKHANEVCLPIGFVLF